MTSDQPGVGDQPDNQPPHGGHREAPQGSSAQRRRLVVRTATVTAALTFVATQLAGWVIGRVADSIASAATPAIHVESSGPIVSPWDVMVPQQPEEVTGALVQPETIGRWALNQGGGPSNRVRVEMMIGGNREHAVILDGIRAIDVECLPPPEWTAIQATVGGEVPMREIQIDLDAGNTVGVPKIDPSLGETFRFPLQVSRSSLEFFTIEVASTKADCSFRLQLDFRDGGAPGKHVIDDGGRRFRAISPRSAAARMEWHSAESGLWTPTKVAA